MEPIPQKSPVNLRLGKPANTRLSLAPKDWPHAPVHRLSENGVYIVTAATLHKEHSFKTDQQLDLLEHSLLSQSKLEGWDLEAWALFPNHYHFVARGNPTSSKLSDFIRKLHSLTAHRLNDLDQRPGRQIWFNYWDTRLTYQHAYLTRLKYVHQNAVKHGLVAIGNQYPWCSASWFERVAAPAQVKTVYSFKIDKVNVPDEF